MKIIISGYGRMGKEIEKVALSEGHQVVARVDNIDDWESVGKQPGTADVVIDFSQPAVAIENIERCFKIGIPIVTGTTGWYNQLDEVVKSCKNNDGTLIYAPNFSIGVNLFFLMNKKLAATMSSFKDVYKASVTEIHHIHKLDSPSGTGLKIAEDLIENHPGLSKWRPDEVFEEGTLPLISLREGEVPGTHLVKYESEADTIEFIHTAKNRSGFARGAVMAAEWVKDKKGVFTMDDLVNSML
jgi:4-hydroxy-tetrahydrodipicolinate reductase